MFGFLDVPSLLEPQSVVFDLINAIAAALNNELFIILCKTRFMPALQYLVQLCSPFYLINMLPYLVKDQIK